MVHFKFSIATALALSVAVLAKPMPLSPDPAGTKNIGNGNGVQFIGGQCLSGADCASTCCATLPTSSGTIGICSGIGAQTQAGKQGCGFGGTSSSSSSSSSTTESNAAAADAAGSSTDSATCAINGSATGSENVGKGTGQQFITGQCLSNADCASTCCAKTSAGTGVCSAVAVANSNGKLGCGFTCSASAAATGGSTNSVTTPTESSTDSAACAINSTAAGSQNVGTGTGQQFITGQCFSNADCASTCCAKTTAGTGVCSAIAVANANGKQGCGFTCPAA